MDTPLLREDMTIEEALAVIRENGVGERIVYFYVVDAEDRLVGVLPTRRFLVAVPEARLSELMIRRVVSIPERAAHLLRGPPGRHGFRAQRSAHPAALASSTASSVSGST